MAQHPVDLLPQVTEQDEINMTAAFINVTVQQGTVLGAPAEERLEDPWLVAICHRWVLSLKHAYTSRDLSGAVWQQFVSAWERAHLDRTGYFDDHPRAFG
ncbi:hypothetical protein [Dactylosporangium sp. CA-092794]|uniref:hypothetical protein n=1 Tax=Dactylosporangium sp. CA-092794 TaxID=3239929 RepID=UPI003D8A224F